MLKSLNSVTLSEKPPEALAAGGFFLAVTPRKDGAE